MILASVPLALLVLGFFVLFCLGSDNEVECVTGLIEPCLLVKNPRDGLTLDTVPFLLEGLFFLLTVEEWDASP